MKIVNNVIRGIAVVGLMGALILGFSFICAALFGGESSLTFRIVFGVITFLGFLAGYFDDGSEVADNPED